MKPEIIKMNGAAERILRSLGWDAPSRKKLRYLAIEVGKLIDQVPSLSGITGNEMHRESVARATKRGRPGRDRSGNRRHVCALCLKIHRDYLEPKSCQDAWHYLICASSAEQKILDAFKHIREALAFIEEGKTGWFNDK